KRLSVARPVPSLTSSALGRRIRPPAGMMAVRFRDADAKSVTNGTLLVPARRRGGVSQPQLSARRSKPLAAEWAMKLPVKSTLLGALAAVTLGVTSLNAQVGLTSSLATVNINATKSSVLSVLINSGGTQNLASLTDN